MTDHPRFFNDIEGAPWADVLRIKQEKLLTQLQYVATRSDFYRRKFGEAGVDLSRVTRLEDVETLPFTEKTELRASLEEAPPLGHHRAAPMEAVLQVQASSGTTGSPAYVGLTRRDQYVWQEMGARCLYGHGIRPGDLTMHTMVTGTGPCSCGRTAPMIRVFGRTDDMLIVKSINVFPSAIRDVVTGFEPRTTGNRRIVADFLGHTTQRPLRIKVEHGPGLAGRGDEIERLRQELSERLRGLLNFAPAVEMVPPETFEKPGVHKVALIVCESP